MSKNLILLNSSHRATVNVDVSYITVTLYDYTADFGLYSNSEVSDGYEEEVPEANLKVVYNAAE
jgi:hypothetical protein